MHFVKISPKYQVVIPKAVRRSMRLRPGQRFHVMEHEGRILLTPDRDTAELRGFLKGINTQIEREEDRPL
jgi:AbrB family looped-hinge helix DNA binding protein